MFTTQTIRAWQGIHKWTSLICTAFLLMLCLTGLPLIFHDEIDAAFDSVAPVALPDDAPDANLDRIVAAVRRGYPTESVRSLFWDDQHPHVIKLFLASGLDSEDAARSHIVSFDARTAQPLGERRPNLSFMSVMLKLHEELFLGLPGELFLGLMGLLFVGSIVSGVLLYAPFMRKLRFGTVRRHGASRIKWLDLHNLLGIATLTWAGVVGVTGVVNTLATPLFGLWQAQTLPALLAQYRHQPRPTPAQFGSVEAAVQQARRALPNNEVTTVVLPNSRFGSPYHYVVWTKGGTPSTSRLFTPAFIDVKTGQLSQAGPLPWYLRALELSRPLHFGDYGGLPLKIIWAALDIVTLMVLGSGLYLWASR